MVCSLALLAGPFLGACTTTLYRANQVSAPLLRDAGEFKATLDLRNVQLAYAPLPGVGLLANGYLESYGDEQQVRRGNGGLAELGAGAFGKLFPNAVWEAYGGLGYGSVRVDDVKDDGGSPRPVHYDAQALRAFVQPNLGYVTPYFEVAGSLRLSALKHLSLNTSGYTPAELEEQFLVADEVTRPVWLFLEPSVTVKVGYKWVKVFVQRTWVQPLGSGALPHESGSAALGISVNIASWFENFQWWGPGPKVSQDSGP
ncbi:MAG: hypothetical protein L0Y64_20380 [Myxococcaceae bacterium]|nr:hypothetical protein [Myxococcaceae bacterium]